MMGLKSKSEWMSNVGDSATPSKYPTPPLDEFMMIWDVAIYCDVLCWRGQLGNGLERRLLMDPKTKVIAKETITRSNDRMPHAPEGVPAYITRWPNGNLRVIEYYMDGKLHRNREPARINYDDRGRMVLAEWYLEGRLHREKGPASMVWKRGKLYREEWDSYDGTPVRDDGPVYRIRERRGWWFEIWHQTDGTRRSMRRHDSGRTKCQGSRLE